MKARPETIELITNYYAAIEANKPEVFGDYYAEDMTLTFGNSPTVKGRASVLDSFSVLGRARTVRHDLLNVWEEDGGQVVIECVGRWEFHDGTTVYVPAMTVFVIADGKITDQRIFVDNAPVAEVLARI